MREFKIHGLLGGAAVLAAAAATIVVGAQGAQAHTPEVSDSCTGLQVNFYWYEGEADNNLVTITIDGISTPFNFGTNFERTFAWSPSEPHTWKVVLDANLVQGDETGNDFTASGSQEACEAPTTTSVPDTTSTTVPDPTTTVPSPTTTLPDPTTTVPDPTTTVPDPTTTVPDPTTTVPDPTTTVPDPTTTVPDPTSTTVAATVTDPPTTPAPTTAVDVQVAPPAPGVTPAPPTVAPPVVPATLPQTGGNSNGIAAAALLLLGAGALGLVVARRQRHS